MHYNMENCYVCYCLQWVCELHTMQSSKFFKNVSKFPGSKSVNDNCYITFHNYHKFYTLPKIYIQAQK